MQIVMFKQNVLSRPNSDKRKLNQIFDRANDERQREKEPGQPIWRIYCWGGGGGENRRRKNARQFSADRGRRKINKRKVSIHKKVKPFDWVRRMEWRRWPEPRAFSVLVRWIRKNMTRMVITSSAQDGCPHLTRQVDDDDFPFVRLYQTNRIQLKETLRLGILDTKDFCM